MERRFDIFFQINDPDSFPSSQGVIHNLPLPDYIKIKHINSFAYNFLINHFEVNNIFDKTAISKLWISIDDVDYKIIFDIDNSEIHLNNNYV